MFKENKKMITVLMGLAFLFAMLASGYIGRLSDQRAKSKNETNLTSERVEENVKEYQEKENLQTSLVDKNIVDKDANIIYKTKYKKCNHEIIKNEKPSEEMIGLDRKAFEHFVKEKLVEWKLDTFSQEKIHLSRELDTLCSDHFVVGERNGNIAIFKIDENGNRVMHRIFKDATISTLREENQKRLKSGIVVESEEEAIQVLEDFIS